jgi:hypothetical protein
LLRRDRPIGLKLADIDHEFHRIASETLQTLIGDKCIRVLGCCMATGSMRSLHTTELARTRGEN